MFSVGIDISKQTIDCAFISNNKNHHQCFINNAIGFKNLLKWLKPYCQSNNNLFCMEATGIYHLALA